MYTKIHAIVCLLITLNIAAQEQTQFSKNLEFYIKGDATVIGNNSVSKHEKRPYNDFSLINDQIKMVYVDIDRDGSTFSSSSATLNIPFKDAKVKKATLYWAGVYPYDRGVIKERGEEVYYEGNDTRQDDFNTIKFKRPNSKYKSITGNLIFDGYGNETYLLSAPYICFADVTSEMQGNVLNGEYTVANIRATQGYASGGSAAGWFLFIVYETEEKPEKYITSYHGFAGLNDNAVEFKFDGFKSKAKGLIDSSIFVATLEGDSKLSRDQCEIKRPSDGAYIPLKNSLRSPKNFFNSKISINNSFFTDRKPNSTNTLGFDLLQMQIPRSALQNNQTETSLRLGTHADRFYLFFTAFSVELGEEFVEPEPVLAVTPEEVSIDEEESATDITKTETTETVISESEMETELKKVDLKIPQIGKGYYLITNVFSRSSNAVKWEEFLKTKGYTPTTFMNPKNRWHYVSVYNNESLHEVYKKHQELENLEIFKDIWVYKINMK
ncbi:MAG: hypothetical protein KJO41_06715 [Bacteroidia bacterium]|nr:hypothetical protein [Bacteroidia bacterium]NND25743.1 hypothetical protein [Flavobacteriaceae bacterium]NNK59727.1 hypothetical protein [Flavobacteriaceae bacterium]NNL33430.1 hypothetical protein [Flavobacteriaceae bacterium]